MDLVPSFVNILSQSFATRMGQNLVQSLPLSPSHAFWVPLGGALRMLPPNNIDPRALNVPQPIAPFIAAALRNVRDAPAEDDAAGALRAFNNLLAVHTELQRLYSETRADGGYKNAFLNGIVLEVCRKLVKVSAVAASISTLPLRDAGSPRGIKDATRQAVEKSLQVSASHMSDSEWNSEVNEAESVGDIMWGLANILWRHYAERKLHTQATELSKTFASIQPSEEKRIAARGECIPQTAVAESYYWRGRLGVVLLEIRGARRWLEKAWCLCPEDAWQQKRAILIRLIPVALLLGRLPHLAVLEHYSLVSEFGPFIHAFKTGNIVAWRRLLSERRDWLRARCIWLIWFERGEILVWRNLFRKALALHYEQPGAGASRCPTSVFLAATRAAFAGSGELEETVELEDIIVVLASLMDQSIIMGNLAYSQRQMVFRPGHNGFGGFPPIAGVTPRRIEAIA